MRVIAKRLFISTVYGNVGAGQVLDVSDAHGKHLIDNGLAEEIKSAGPVDVLKSPEKSSAFPNPVEASQGPGSFSPVAPALPQPIAKPSEPGVKPKRQKKDTSR